MSSMISIGPTQLQMSSHTCSNNKNQLSTGDGDRTDYDEKSIRNEELFLGNLQTIPFIGKVNRTDDLKSEIRIKLDLQIRGPQSPPKHICATVDQLKTIDGERTYLK